MKCGLCEREEAESMIGYCVACEKIAFEAEVVENFPIGPSGKYRSIIDETEQ